MERRTDSPDEMLRNFLALAREVPAYAKVFADGKGSRLEDFPIIDKAYVKEHYNDFVNKQYKGPTLVVHTSGTTGNSLDVLQSQNFEHRQWATWWRYREELGIKYGTWYGWFGCGEMIHLINKNKGRYLMRSEQLPKCSCMALNLVRSTNNKYSAVKYRQCSLHLC